MTDHAPTLLSSLAERAAAKGEWWKEDALDKPNALALPARVLAILANADITTVEQLKAAGPAKLRELPHLGKQAFEQIIELLRELDRQNGGGSNGHERGQVTLR
ncbi:hypothetical protein KIP88_02390 [Bradyrhizobium sp. SRL28]|uniref:helix-hairpin-helix domain-containing protein n=1 Tax=Bradyrhizobium sp. SRL28 TaxID=2836178 RepID=UPI001BDE38FE|nr:DNA-directed RNA polymerase subunit alpha C-terminal domain-containing protein [Bradyrhizobium sp. SRL28]MBT1509338.1 hypothetical protein [Bradyrhizobium sp. SRL28]